MRDRSRPRGHRGLYLFGRFLFYQAFRWIWRCRVRGAEHVPQTGGFIVAANHASYADPPLVGSFLDRPLYFMAKEELFRFPPLGALLRRVNAFPLQRKRTDVGAYKNALDLLAQGEGLLLFPEGSRQKNGLFGHPKPGVGHLALKSGCPVVPAYVGSTRNWWKFAALSVNFGPPLWVKAGELPGPFAQRVMAAIAHLKETKS